MVVVKARIFIALCVISAVFANISCGASDRPAPYVISGMQPQAQQCIDPNAFVPNLLAFLRQGGFQPLADIITNELEPTGAFSDALSAFLRLAKKTPPPQGLLKPLAEILEVQNLEPLIAIERNAFYYIAGDPPAKEPHYEVPVVIGHMLNECDPDSVLNLGQILLSTHMPLGCRVGDEGCQLATTALIKPLHDLLADPFLRTLLSLINFGQIPEESFVMLVDQVVNLLKNPSFEFQQLRDLMQRLVYPFIPVPELKVKLDNLFNVLSVLTSPEVGMMESMRATLVCLGEKDPNRAVHRMLYNLIVDPQFQLVELIQAVDATVAVDPSEQVARYLIEVIKVLRNEPVTHKAICGLVARLFEERNAKKLVPMLINIKNSGLADDLARLLDSSSTTSCGE